MQYDSYKDSGEQWLGQIPSHWEMKRLEASFSLRREKYSPQETLGILSLLKDVGIVPYEEKGNVGNTAKTDVTQYKVARKGDLVINSMNVIIGSLGITPLDGYISPAYYAFAPRKNICTQYFNYVLSLRRAQQNIRRFASGIMEIRLKVSAKDFLSINYPLPPLAEQERMVVYLDKETAAIDAAIAQQQRMIDLLNERKQIIIQQAVTKGLDPNAKMKDSGIDWIGQIPEGWEVKPLKRCCNNIREKAQQPCAIRVSLENIESWTGCYVPTESMYDGLGILCKPDDVIFGKLRPYLAKIMLVQKECEALGDFWVLRPRQEILGKYLQIILLTKSLIDIVDSSTYGAKMPRADWNTNSKIMIPLPSLEIQKEIVSRIEMVGRDINKQISLSDNIISLLRERKQIIINEVVTGKIKV